MGECRFEKYGVDEQIACSTPGHDLSKPISCAVAAAELERRVEVAYQMVAKAESDVATLSKRLARLEEEKALLQDKIDKMRAAMDDTEAALNSSAILLTRVVEAKQALGRVKERRCPTV